MMCLRHALAPVDPFQMILNFLNAIQQPLQWIATALAVVVVIILIIRAIASAQQGSFNVWQFGGTLLGVIILWVIMFNLNGIMCWVAQTMDPTFVCP